MALETFSPGRNPNLGMGFSKQPRVLAATFGDGYVQRTPDGLNEQPRTFQLEWGPVTVAVADYIEDFFSRHKGAQPFWWQSPRDTSPRKYVCPQWTRDEPQWNASAITATFVEDFSLEV
jgi:phage-related protein